MAEQSSLSPEVEELLNVIDTLYWALDDASTVVDADEEEEYAYQAELESSATVMERYGRHTGRSTS